MKSKTAITIANHLPLKVCYWVLIRMGVRFVGGPQHPEEEVPAVPFLEVLNRCHAELVEQ